MKILLGIKDRDLLESLTALLEGEGYEITPAFDGVQVIKEAKGEMFDLCLADENIPRVDFLEVLKNLKSFGIKLVALSFKGTQSGGEKDYPVLCYPFSPSELIQLIKSVTSNRGDAF